MVQRNFIYHGQEQPYSCQRIKHIKPNINLYDILILTDMVLDPFNDSLEFYAIRQETQCLVSDDGYASYNLLCLGKPEIKQNVSPAIAQALSHDQKAAQRELLKQTDNLYVIGEWTNLDQLVSQLVLKTQKVYQQIKP